MSGPGGVAGDQLRALVERIEHIEEEIKSLNEGKKEVYAEAKGEGFDTKVLREVIRLRKQDREEMDEPSRCSTPTCTPLKPRQCPWPKPRRSGTSPCRSPRRHRAVDQSLMPARPWWVVH